jgi:hypothetical protein
MYEYDIKMQSLLWKSEEIFLQFIEWAHSAENLYEKSHNGTKND